MLYAAVFSVHIALSCVSSKFSVSDSHCSARECFISINSAVSVYTPVWVLFSLQSLQLMF